MIQCVPTDTCYGLACTLSDSDGYGEIYRLKGRDFKKPLAFLIKDFDSLPAYADLTDSQIEFLRQYTHPFTLLVAPKRDFRLPSFLDPDRYIRIGLRIGEKCLGREIYEKLPFPLFLTSANRSNEPECRSPKECEETFGGKIHIIGGGLVSRPTSDIFSFVGDTMEIEYIRKNYE